MSNHQFSDKIINDSIVFLNSLIDNYQYQDLNDIQKQMLSTNKSHLVISLNNHTKDHLTNPQVLEIQQTLQRLGLYEST